MASCDASVSVCADVSGAIAGIQKLQKSLSLIKLDSLTNLASKAIGVGKSFIDATAGIQQLKAGLTAVTGSAKKGNAVFRDLDKFAQSTQFNVEQLSDAYIKLRNAGIEPTQKLMKTLADTTAISKDQLGSLEAFTDLMSRTTQGGLQLEDLNRLQDRGIPVFQVLQKELGLSRLELTEFGKSADGANKIVNTLLDSLGNSTAGNAAKMANTLGTAWQNVASAIKNAWARLGELGLNDWLVSAMGWVQNFANNWEAILIPRFKLAADWIKFVGEWFISLYNEYAKPAIDWIASKLSSVSLESLSPASVMAGIEKGWIQVKAVAALGINNIVSGFNEFVIKAKRIWAILFDWIENAFNSMINRVKSTLNDWARSFNSILPDWVKENVGSLGEIEIVTAQIASREAELNAELAKQQTLHDNIASAIVRRSEAEQAAIDKATPKANYGYTAPSADTGGLGLPTGGGPMVPMSAGAKQATENQIYKEQLDEKYKALEGYINSEQALLEQSYGWKYKALEELHTAGKIGDKEYYAAQESMQSEATQSAISSLGEGLNALGQHNEKAFKMAKAMNIALAIQDTWKGAQAAFASMAPIPFIGPALGIAAAAGAVAAGMARVASIRSQTYQGRQYGGGVTGGQTYMVGERGPELFTPGAGGGTITPNNELGGKTVNVNFSIQAVDSKGVDDLLLTRKPMIVSMIRQAVNEQPGILG